MIDGLKMRVAARFEPVLECDLPYDQECGYEPYFSQ